MTTYLLDTNVVSYYTRRDAPTRFPEIVERVKNIEKSPGFAISFITVYEIERGLLDLERRGDGKARRARFTVFLDTVATVSVDASLAIASQLWVDSRARGRELRDADIIVAASAILSGGTLATTDEPLATCCKELGLSVELWNVR